MINNSVNGVIRRNMTLDWLIDHYSSRKPPAQNGYARQILRLSIFHLLYLDSIPPHAILYQAGELAKDHVASWEISYINGLLRNVLRNKDNLPKPEFTRPIEYLSYTHSHPQWIIESWLKSRTFQEVEDICRVDNIPPPIFVRCNKLKINPSELEREFNEEGVHYDLQVGTGDFWRIKSSTPIGTLKSFRAGHFQVQDLSTIRAVELLDPFPGEKIADLCAAPGGKTALIAQKMQNTGCLLAADNNPGRLNMLSRTIQRLGIVNADIKRINLLREDPLNQKKQWDGILLDVPCSNTGVLRRRVDVRWRLKPGDIVRLAEQGLKLLLNSAGIVLPGGRIVYSTCSLQREENSEVIRRFLRINPMFNLIQEESSIPREEAGDGYYCALLRHIKK